MKRFIQNNSFIILFFVITFTMSLMLTVKFGHPEDYAVIVVEQNDTIWGYAVEYKDVHKMSYQSFIAWVYDYNDIHDFIIRPGETLILPIASSALADKKTEVY